MGLLACLYVDRLSQFALVLNSSVISDVVHPTHIQCRQRTSSFEARSLCRKQGRRRRHSNPVTAQMSELQLSTRHGLVHKYRSCSFTADARGARMSLASNDYSTFCNEDITKCLRTTIERRNKQQRSRNENSHITASTKSPSILQNHCLA